jgi:hypothetical protein
MLLLLPFLKIGFTLATSHQLAFFGDMIMPLAVFNFG